MRMSSIVQEKRLWDNYLNSFLLHRNNLFSSTRVCILLIFIFNWLTISLKFVAGAEKMPVQKRLVSSANRIGTKSLETEGKSFIRTKKSNGPRIEPWWTPHLISIGSDSWVLYITNWSRADKRLENQPWAMPQVYWADAPLNQICI